MDKNTSDTSSYLDLTPLYGNNIDAQMAVRTKRHGLLKPDTFAEHRLLNQPPGVTCYLIMYNRFHNYVAKQLLAINENSRFALPTGAVLDRLTPEQRKQAEIKQDEDLFQTARLITCGMYIQIAIHDYLRCLMAMHAHDTAWTLDPRTSYEGMNDKHGMSRGEGNMVSAEFNVLYRFHSPISERDAEWSKDLFELWVRRTGKVKPDDQVTQEQLDRGEFITETMAKSGDISVPFMRNVIDSENDKAKKSWDDKAKLSAFPEAFGGRWTRDKNGNFTTENGQIKTFGRFTRNADGKFDDAMLAEELMRTMEDPIHQFGARNIPKVFRSVEILGILQARKWELATLNEFREFFGMSRHKHFADINSNTDIQNALRDLYEDPDMVELYPGLMCEGDERCLDPGVSCPGEQSTALWRAVFSDAVTLVRSDRFYTIDWNKDSLTSWGFKELTSDPKINKGSVMHRLFQRALPGYFDYNSIHMWQPFYTPAKNLVYAEAQGYLNFLNLRNIEYKTDANGWKPLDRADRSKPGYIKSFAGADYMKGLSKRIRRNMDVDKKKTLAVIDTYDDVKAILDDPTDSKNNIKWVNPGVAVSEDIPEGALRQIITNTWPKWNSALETFNNCVSKFPDREQTFMNYFVGMSREIRLREQRKFQKIPAGNGKLEEQVYQIDVVKDYAIPVVTRFLVDFLGNWDQVKTNQSNVDRPYTENQIYQHIDNCQNFQSWDSDETKVWQRRVAFKESMAFLQKFAEGGVAKSDYTPYAYAAGLRRWLKEDRSEQYQDQPYATKVRELAIQTVAALKSSGLSQKEIAAVMLSFALDIAHKIVLTFTEIIAYFVDPTKHEDKTIGSAADDTQTQRWKELKVLAAKNTPAADNEIKNYVREAHRLSYNLKLCRKHNSTEPSVLSKTTVAKDDMVLLDIFAASQNAKHFKNPSVFDPKREAADYLIYGGGASFTKKLGLVALAGLVKHAAQLHYLRVAHDKLGRLKRVDTPDGQRRYANATWDSLLPFPSTWNLRFSNGEGDGVYEGGDNANQGHGLDQIYRPLPVKKPRTATQVNGAAKEPVQGATGPKAVYTPQVTAKEVYN